LVLLGCLDRIANKYSRYHYRLLARLIRC